MIRSRWVVLLDETANRQTWLGYDNVGRIGNANYDQAFRYQSYNEARTALTRVRRQRRWPRAEILETQETEQ